MHHYGRSRSPKKERAAQRHLLLYSHKTDWSFAHARPERDRARARVAQYVRDAQISFLIEKMSGTSGKIISIK